MATPTDYNHGAGKLWNFGLNGPLERAAFLFGENAMTDTTFGQEITPAMIEAGAQIIWNSFGDVIFYGSDLGSELASEVFLAMTRAAQSASISIEHGSEVSQP